MKIFIFLLSSLALAHNEDSATKLKARFSRQKLDASSPTSALDIMGFVRNRRKS